MGQQGARLGARVVAARADQADKGVVRQVGGVERVAQLLAQPHRQPAMMVTIELRDGIGGVGFRGRQDAPGAILQMGTIRSEEHTSELQSLMRISYAVFCLKKKKKV